MKMGCDFFAAVSKKNFSTNDGMQLEEISTFLHSFDYKIL